jgi:hypothetical protein
MDNKNEDNKNEDNVDECLYIVTSDYFWRNLTFVGKFDAAEKYYRELIVKCVQAKYNNDILDPNVYAYDIEPQSLIRVMEIGPDGMYVSDITFTYEDTEDMSKEDVSCALCSNPSEVACTTCRRPLCWYHNITCLGCRKVTCDSDRHIHCMECRACNGHKPGCSKNGLRS